VDIPENKKTMLLDVGHLTVLTNPAYKCSYPGITAGLYNWASRGNGSKKLVNPVRSPELSPSGTLCRSTWCPVRTQKKPKQSEIMTTITSTASWSKGERKRTIHPTWHRRQNWWRQRWTLSDPKIDFLVCSSIKMVYLPYESGTVKLTSAWNYWSIGQM
jgi:hypothetical protein